MKKNIFVAIICFLTLNIAAYAQKPLLSGNTEGIKWKVTEVDFGGIEQNTPKIAEFEFSNTGTTPLIVTNATGECGCTSIKWPKEPIMPGKTGKITTTYDAANLGTFNKTIRVTLNIQDDLHELKIKGTVIKKR